MMRFSRTALLLALSLAAGAQALAAQTISSPFRHIEQTQSPGLFVGYLWTDPDVSINDSTSAPLGVASGPLFGVRYQVRAAGPLSIEAAVGVSPTERRLFEPRFQSDSAVVVPNDLETTVPATVVVGDIGLRFHLTGPRTWNGLAPFVAGFGSVVGDVRGTTPEEEAEGLGETERFRFGPSFAVGTALGTDWFPTRSLSLRVEAQGRLWRVSTPRGFLVGAETERSQWNPAVGVSVGGAIHF